MDLSHDGDKLAWAFELSRDLPESFAAHCVKVLGEIDEGLIKIFVLRQAFLVQLTCSKDHVGCTSAFPKSRLVLRLFPSRWIIKRFRWTHARIMSAIERNEIHL